VALCGPLRRLTVAVALAAGLTLAAGPAAGAATDVLANVSPASPVPAGLAERYPLGQDALDSHFAAVEASLTGGVDASGVPAIIAHFLANTPCPHAVALGVDVGVEDPGNSGPRTRPPSPTRRSAGRSTRSRTTSAPPRRRPCTTRSAGFVAKR
jgi:hypothetical protein